MFQSGDSDEEQYSIMKDEYHIPIYLWAEHFSRPLKRRNRYMTCLINKEFIQTKGKYVFLDDSQIMGKTLESLGIPNICGKVCKKFILNYTSIKFCNRKHIYEKSFKNSSTTWRKPVFHNKTQKLKISKKSDSNLWKNLKCTGDTSQNSYELENSNYTTTERDWFKSKDKDNLPKKLFLDSKAEGKKVCNNFSSTENSYQHKKFSSETTFDNLLLKPCKTYNKPYAKIKKIYNYKKTVRFNDEDLCSFAPSQYLKNAVLPNESERLFDEVMSVLKSKESNNTMDVNEGKSANRGEMSIMNDKQNDNTNVHKVGSDTTYTHDENCFKEKCSTITYKDKELDKVNNSAEATKLCLNNSTINTDINKPKDKLNEIMPNHFTDKFATNIVPDFKEHIQSSNPDNYTEVNKLSFEGGSSLTSNGSANINSNIKTDVEYKKNNSSVARKINEISFNDQSKLCLVLENPKMTNVNQMQYTDSENNQRCYTTVETNVVKPVMKYLHEKLSLNKLKVNSADKSRDMKLTGNLSSKAKFNDGMSGGNVSMHLHETKSSDVIRGNICKKSISEDLVQVEIKNCKAIENTTQKKMQNMVLVEQDEHALPEQAECQAGNDWDNSVLGYNTELEISSRNKNITHVTVEKENLGHRVNFNEEFIDHDSSDEYDSLYFEDNRKKSVIISRQSDSEYDESDLENNDSLVDSSCDLYEEKMSAKEEKTTDNESEDEIPPSQTVKQKEYLISNVRKDKLNENENNCSYNKLENIAEKRICDDNNTQKVIIKENFSLLPISLPDISGTEILSCENIKTSKTFLPELSKPNLNDVIESQPVSEFFKNTVNNRISVTNALKLNNKPIHSLSSISKTDMSKKSRDRIKSENIYESLVLNSDSNIDSDSHLKCYITDTIHFSRMKLLQHKTVNNEEAIVTVNECYTQNDKKNVLSSNYSEEITLATQKEKMHISSPISINVKHKIHPESEKNILSEDYCKSEVSSKERRNVKTMSPSLSEFPQNSERSQIIKQGKLCKQDDRELENTSVSKSETTKDITQTSNVINQTTQLLKLQYFGINQVSKNAKLRTNRRVQLSSKHAHNNKINSKETEETKCKSETEVDNSKNLTTKGNHGTKDTNIPKYSTLVSKGCAIRKYNLGYSKQLTKINQTEEKEEVSTKYASPCEEAEMPNEDVFNKDDKTDYTHSNTAEDRVFMLDVLLHTNNNGTVENINNLVNKDNGERIVINEQLKSITVFENQKSPNDINCIQQSDDKNITDVTADKENEKELYDEYNINKEFSNDNLDENKSLYIQGNKQDSENEYKESRTAESNVDLTDEGIINVNITKSKTSEIVSEDEIPPSQVIEQKGYFTPSIQKRDVTKSVNKFSCKKLENAPQKMNCYEKHTPKINVKENSCDLYAKVPNDSDTERSSCKSTTIRKSLFCPSPQVYSLLEPQLSEASENIKKKCTISASDIIELKTIIHSNAIKNTNTQNLSMGSRMRLCDLRERDNLVLSSKSNTNIDTKFSVSDAINISKQNMVFKEINNEELKASESMCYNEKQKESKLNYDISETVTLSVQDDKIHVSSPLNINAKHSIPIGYKTKILPEVFKNCEQEDENKKADILPLPIKIYEQSKVNKVNSPSVSDKTLLVSNKSLKLLTDGGNNKILISSSTNLKKQGCSLGKTNDKITATKICVSQLSHPKTNMLHCASPIKLNKLANKKMKANSVSSPSFVTHKMINDNGYIGRGIERTEGKSGLAYSTSLNSHMVETNSNALMFGSSDSIRLHKSNHDNSLKTAKASNNVNEEKTEFHKVYLTTDKIPRKYVAENYIPKNKDSQIKCKRKSKYEHSDDKKFVKKLKMNKTSIIKDSRNKYHVETIEETGEETDLANEHSISFKCTDNSKTSTSVDYIQLNTRTKQSCYKIFDNNFSNFEDHHSEQEDMSNDYNYFETNNNINKKNSKFEVSNIVEVDTEYSKSELAGRKKLSLLFAASTSEPVQVTKEESCNNPAHDTGENYNYSSDGNGVDAKNSDPITNELIISTNKKKVGSSSTYRTDSVYTSLSDHLSDGDWRDRLDEISNDSDDSYFLARMFDKPGSALRTLRTWDDSVDENMDKFTGLDCI